jgi:hypothetical protein
MVTVIGARWRSACRGRGRRCHLPPLAGPVARLHPAARDITAAADRAPDEAAGFVARVSAPDGPGQPADTGEWPGAGG